ncbi:MAG: GIY-YIG nuclease family protein [bacterium]
MIGIVYILILSNGQYYVGSTNNLERRLTEHNSGKTPSIKYKLPARLIFHQEFATLIEARQAEYKIKRQKSRKLIEEILQRGCI